MVKLKRHIVFICFILLCAITNAQRFEAGLKAFRSNDYLKIDYDKLTNPLVDSLSTISSSDKKKQGLIGAYAKFYPHNNNLFFMTEIYSVRERHQFSHTYYENVASKINGYGQNVYGSSHSSFAKFTFNFMAGYEFPKSKVVKFYVAGGLHYFRGKYKADISKIDKELYSDYISDVLAMQNQFLSLRQSNIGLSGNLGFRVDRISLHFGGVYYPSTKKTEAVSTKKLAIEGSLFYSLFNTNVSRSQYKEKKQTSSKSVIASNARLILSVFGELKFYNDISSFQYKDQFLFVPKGQGLQDTTHPSGNLTVNIAKVRRIYEIPGVGFAYQIRLPLNLYFKNYFFIGQTELRYGETDFLSGGYFSKSYDSTLTYTKIKGSAYSLETKFRHKKMNFAIGYSSRKRIAPFGEIGIAMHSWDLKENKITQFISSTPEGEGGINTGRTTSSTELATYESMGPKLNIKKRIVALSATVGYKLHNFLLFVNYNRTLGDLNAPNQYGAIGKYSEVKVGIAYQFVKFYFKKK